MLRGKAESLSSLHCILSSTMASTANETKRKSEYDSERDSKLFKHNTDHEGDREELLPDVPLEGTELTDEEEAALDYIPEYREEPISDHDGERSSATAHLENLKTFLESDSETSEQISKPGITCSVKKVFAGLGYLSGFPPSGWNDISNLVYYALKIKRFIVHPNYILCMTTNPYVASEKNYEPTVNDFLNDYGNPSFVKWKNVKGQLLKLKSLFRGCEDVPNGLRDPEQAIRILRFKFKRNIAAYLDSNTVTLGAFQDLLYFLHDFSIEFVNELSCHTSRESHFADYFNHLLIFFTTTLGISGPQTGTVRSLTLAPGDRRLVTMRPDLELTLQNSIVITGEFKNFGVVPKEYEDYKRHRVEDPAESKPLPHPTTHRPQVPQNTDKLIYYRKLNRKERFKVDCVLPQLIADMLAAMERNKKTGRYVKRCQENERAQLGIALEGFKLRFVRLVLRHTDQGTEPDVSQLGNSRIRCDVFLTQELNLFKESHLEMFFQLMYAILKAHAK